MKFGPLCRFVHRFAWRDLWDPGARRSTRVNSASMALVTALTLASVGLALGTTEIKCAKLTDDPLALCLWIGDPSTDLIIDTPTWKQLDAVLSKGETKNGYLSCYPFHVRRHEWLRPDAAGDGTWIRIWGRTIMPGDPVLKSREPFHSGGPFTSPDQEGIIVATSMLETLGLPVKSPPEYMTMSLAGGKEKIKVIGVFDRKLPNDHQFLLTDAYHQKLKRIEKGLVGDSLETGPVPASWKKFSDLDQEKKQEIVNFLRGLGVEDDPRERPAGKGKARTWLLKSVNSAAPPSRQNWLVLLNQILDIMGTKDDNFADAGQIILSDSTRKSVDPAETTDAGWQMMGVYFNEVDKLPLAAGVIADVTPVPVHKEVIEQLLEFDRASSKALLTCLIGALVLLASSCANLRVIQELRSELKLGEIGMLKAMGMSSGLLSGIFLYEAALVWAVGTVVGLSLGFVLGALLSWLFIASNPSQILLGFWCPWYIWLLPLITGPTFLFSAFWGIRRARRSPPIETLRTS